MYINGRVLCFANICIFPRLQCRGNKTLLKKKSCVNTTNDEFTHQEEEMCWGNEMLVCRVIFFFICTMLEFLRKIILIIYLIRKLYILISSSLVFCKQFLKIHLYPLIDQHRHFYIYLYVYMIHLGFFYLAIKINYSECVITVA